MLSCIPTLLFSQNASAAAMGCMHVADAVSHFCIWAARDKASSLHLSCDFQGLAASEKMSQLAGWRRVVQTYWKHWTRLHPAVGLVQLPQGGVALVRLGHMLTLLQKPSPLASLHHTGSLTAASATHAGLSSDLALLTQATQLLQQLLGQDVVDLFVQLWAHPLPGLSLQGLCCAFTQVLSIGPQRASQQQSQQATARNQDALQHWRRQRSAAILQLGHLISQMTHHTPVSACRDYIALLPHASLPVHTDSSGQLSPSSGAALTIMLRQSVSQQMQSASRMLLLAWMGSLRAAGSLHLSATVSQVLKAEIVPELQAHLCSAAITQWLCTAPAAALSDGEAVSIKHSHNTSQLARLDILSGSREEVQHQQSLAELLLPGFLQHSGGQESTSCPPAYHLVHKPLLPARLVAKFVSPIVKSAKAALHQRAACTIL